MPYRQTLALAAVSLAIAAGSNLLGDIRQETRRQIQIATFNTSLNRRPAGKPTRDLKKNVPQTIKVALIP